MTIAFATKVAATIRDDGLRVMGNLLRDAGVLTPNLNKGSDDYNWFQAVGNEVEALYAGIVVAADQLMPDTATGSDLDRLLAAVGLSRRGAKASTGKIVYSTTVAGLVVVGQALLDPAGNTFTVTTSGTYANGDKIPVQSSATGKSTVLPGGTTLRWNTPPIGAASTAVLDSFGARGGVDQEDDETARRRLLDYYRNPPSAGNASSVAVTAEAADSGVEKCFVYPAADGPGTGHVAITGYATSSASRSRVATADALALATSAIVAYVPEYVQSVVTTTVDQPADVSFVLRLPAATTAIPAGAGGGFVDAIPFPSVTGITASRIYCRCTANTNSTTFRVESMVAPIVGQSICWIDRDTFTLHTAKILTLVGASVPSGGTPGTWDITIDAPFVATTGTAVSSGDYIFPAAVRTQAYLDAILASFAALGPGEKQRSIGLLPRSYRRPRNFESWDYTLGDQFLRELNDAGSEVQSSDWGYQNGTVTTPTLPTTIAAGPQIFTPRQIGIYST